jgi:hypothetical protein
MKNDNLIASEEAGRRLIPMSPGNSENIARGERMR